MFLDPREVLRHVTGKSTIKVGDFGAGAGVYALALAEQFPDGSVYALEAHPAHVEALTKKRIKNLFPLAVDLNARIPLKDELLDMGIVVNTLHALAAREQFLNELHRVLVPRGSVLVVDWIASFNNIGPTDDAVVAPGDAVRLFHAHGFSAGPMLPAGSHHWTFVAQKL